MIDLIFAGICAATWGTVFFPEETEKAKKVVKEAVKLTREQMSASARTENGDLVKGYRTQEDARRGRTKLAEGDVVYLPNGSIIKVEKGMKDVQSDGWWYAWTTL